MSTVFSRNKEKRPRSSTSESNNSFVKNVTSRVSGFLPATITKWFSSPGSSNANGSTPAADVTDSSTEDEAAETPVSSQPPAKRMRLSTPGKLDCFSPTDRNSVVRLVESKETPIIPYNAVQSPPGRNTFRRETNYVSTPVRANEESVIERNDKDTPLYKTQHTVTAIGQSVAKKRKSLFEALSPSDSVKHSKPTLNTSLDPRLPNFKPALLGSPFYHGRTMYGGAASSYINQPNIKQQKIAYVNESNANETATMSQSTRRIMDLLENYSSPLSEAKRIPRYVKPTRTEIPNVNNENSQNNKVNSYKMQELHVPGIASILRLKQKSRIMDTTSAARQLIASHSSATEYNPYPSSKATQKENNSKENSLSTKIKSRVTRQLRGDSINEVAPPPVQLPNAVLQIDDLPSFTLDKPATSAFTVAASSVTSTSSNTTAVTAAISSVFSTPYYITMSHTSTSKPGITCNSRPFRFSSPVKVSSEIQENCKTPPKFEFGSPDRSIDRPKVDKIVDSSVVVGSVKETAKSVDNIEDGKCCASNMSNMGKCTCRGKKAKTIPVETPLKCIVCKLANSQPHINKCVNCEKLNSKSAVSISVIKPVNSSQWKCSECWVGNDQDAEKCVCCGANNPKKSETDTTNNQSSEEAWKCFICWITNENNVDKCACCGTSRNFASFNKSSKCSVCKLADNLPNNNKCVNCDKIQLSNTNKTKLADKSQWKCQECWVQNEENADKCVCCAVGNPNIPSTGSVKEKSSTASSSASNGNWKCEECWITNKNSDNKCDACGGPKPDDKTKTPHNFGTSSSKLSDDVFKTIATSQKGSKWECSSCLVRNDDDKTICVCCGADRDYKAENIGLKSFNFGQNTTNSFKFGINPNFQNNNTSSMEHTSIGDELVVDECETNNNVVEKTPTFTFTLPTKKFEYNVKKTKENENEVPKIQFNFGIQQNSEFLNVTKILEPNKIVEEKQSVREVPKVDVIASVQNQVKPMPSLFTPPIATTAAPSPIVLALLGSEKNDILSNSSPSLSFTATPSAKISQPENKFTFSAGIKPSMNIFNAPVTTTAPASTVSLFGPPLQIAVTTTAAPSIPMFQKPETNTTSTVTMFMNKNPVTTSTISIFQKNESVATTAPASIAPTAPFFSFGLNTPKTTQASGEKPKFNFTFGSSYKSETSTVFKPTFGSLGDSSNSTNKFALPTANILSGGNGLSGNSVSGPNGLSTGSTITGNVSTSGNILGAPNELPPNQLSAGNGLQNTSSISANIFGAPVLKENMWPSNNNNNNNSNNASTNIFVSNPGSNILQKPATFTFGSSSPFNANNSTPAFGSNPQPAQNIFGMTNQSSGTQQSLFASPAPSQAVPTVFGSPTPVNNPAPSMSMFGTPNASAAPTFGALNQQLPSFEGPSHTPTPAAPFSFGSSQPSAVFGFGSQPQQPQSGVYNFNAPGVGAPQVHFNMGSAPNTTQRRLRKAVRRNPQR